MGTTDDVLEVLDAAACRDLVRTVPVGRLAWAEPDGHVEIRLLNVGLDGDDLVFRVADGPVLDAVRAGRPLTFEADRIEAALRTGWSVVVVGHGAEDAPSAVEGQVTPWVRAERPWTIRLCPERITGRRVRLAAGGVAVVDLSEDEEP
ncbi:MAG TPA: pyridoxamine 5'-phosphate oxidase family protein [Actinomycetospora sp.]|nr:pyridoxamine 5'-phosphate oxidase family protein [Actinomycetospora sp.]